MSTWHHCAVIGVQVGFISGPSHTGKQNKAASSSLCQQSLLQLFTSSIHQQCKTNKQTKGRKTSFKRQILHLFSPLSPGQLHLSASVVYVTKQGWDINNGCRTNKNKTKVIFYINNPCFHLHQFTGRLKEPHFTLKFQIWALKCSVVLFLIRTSELSWRWFGRLCLIKLRWKQPKRHKRSLTGSANHHKRLFHQFYSKKCQI